MLCYGAATARGAVLGGQHPLEAQQQVQVALRHHLLLQRLEVRVPNRDGGPAPQNAGGVQAIPVLPLHHCTTPARSHICRRVPIGVLANVIVAM